MGMHIHSFRTPYPTHSSGEALALPRSPAAQGTGMIFKLVVIFVVWKNTPLSEGLCLEKCVDLHSCLGVAAIGSVGGRVEIP